MLLAIDVGNTNMVIGLYDNDVLIDNFRLQTDILKTEDEYATLVFNCLANFNVDPKRINDVIISSVVAGINFILEKLFKKYLNIDAIFVGPNLKSGIAIKLDQPKSLAADILVGVVAANHKYPQDNCLVIDMGTATTMVIVTKEKDFIGGAILPGVNASAESLASNASALPHINLDIPNKVICRDTIECMQSGILYGYASMIDGMIDKMSHEFEKPLRVVITGGLAKKITTLLKTDVVVDDNLILDGLLYLYHKNKS